MTDDQASTAFVLCVAWELFMIFVLAFIAVPVQLIAGTLGFHQSYIWWSAALIVIYVVKRVFTSSGLTVKTGGSKS